MALQALRMVTAVSVMTPATVRTRRARWVELRDLLRRVQLLMEHNIQIDAIDGVPHKKVTEIAEFEQDLARVQFDMLRELNRVTVDRLRAELQEKKDRK